MRLLDRLDPVFARFASVCYRIGELVRPAMERVAQLAARVVRRVEPIVDRAVRVSEAVFRYAHARRSLRSAGP